MKNRSIQVNKDEYNKDKMFSPKIASPAPEWEYWPSLVKHIVVGQICERGLSSLCRSRINAHESKFRCMDVIYDGTHQSAVGERGENTGRIKLGWCEWVCLGLVEPDDAEADSMMQSNGIATQEGCEQWDQVHRRNA